MSGGDFVFFTSERLLALAPWVLSMAFGILLAWRLLRVLPWQEGGSTGQRSIRDDESGTAVLEFVLVFPYFVMILLVVMQLALMINAKLVVGYAAFAAARSATVWIPEPTASEGANTISADRSSEKWQRILAAARIGCLPIASETMWPYGYVPIEGGAIPEIPGVGALLDRAIALPALTVHDLGSENLTKRLERGAFKWLYGSSEKFTQVKIEGMNEEGMTSYGADAPITVTVTHHFYLSVPYAGTAFAVAFGEGWVDKVTKYFILPTMKISEFYTLMNSGRVRGL